MSDEQFIGFILFPCSVIGVWTNLSVILFFRKVDSLRSSFGIISANQALCNFIYCLVALVYLVPTLIWDIRFLKQHSHHSGFIFYICYDTSTESHLLISINRFIAVYFPQSYSKIFKPKSTYYFLIGLWNVLSIIHAIVALKYDCKMYYDERYWVFVYSDNDACSDVAFYTDFVFHICVVSCVTILNISTFIGVKKSNKIIASAIDQKTSKRKEQAERNFFKQILYQCTIYTIGLFTYFFVSRLIDSNWLRFFVITVPWIVIHSLDGMVVILCNPELWKICKKRWTFSKDVEMTTAVVTF